MELCVFPISRIAELFTPTIALGAFSEGVRRNSGETQVHPVREMGPVWGHQGLFCKGLAEGSKAVTPGEQLPASEPSVHEPMQSPSRAPSLSEQP